MERIVCTDRESCAASSGRMEPVKIAVIGNRHDHTLPNLNAMKAHPETFDIIGAAELDETKSLKPFEGIRIYTLDELLCMDRLEAVVIEAGKEYEIGYAQKFADRGLPVFLDKPGSADLPRFERFMSTMKSKRLPVQIGYMYRFNPMVVKAAEMVDGGKLGEIFSVEAQMSIYHKKEKREWLGRYKGGMMFYLGCHLVDMVCRFAGFPKEIIPLSCSTHSDGIDSEDYGCAIFRYDNGVSFIKTCAGEYNGFDRRQLVISGTKGTLEIRPWEILTDGGQLTDAKLTLASDAPPQAHDGSKPLRSEVYERYYPMLLHFAKLVRGEAVMQHDYDYEVRLLETIIKACGAEDNVFIG